MQSEIKKVWNTVQFIGFTLYSTLPTFTLGWLISAIVRVPDANKQLKSELVYSWLLMYLENVDIKLYVAFLVIVISFVAVYFRDVNTQFGFRFVDDKIAHSVKKLLKTLIIPTFISSAALAAGMSSGNSLLEIKSSVSALIVMSVIVGAMYYALDDKNE